MHRICVWTIFQPAPNTKQLKPRQSNIMRASSTQRYVADERDFVLLKNEICRLAQKQTCHIIQPIADCQMPAADCRLRSYFILFVVVAKIRFSSDD